MAYLIDADTLQSNDFGYRFDEGEDVTVASGVLVSSTELAGVYSEYANSQLFNNGYIISTGASGGGLGVLFDLNDGSAFNAAGASITGFDIGVKFYGDRLALINDGTIRGLRQDGVFVAEFADDGIVNNIGTITATDRDPLFFQRRYRPNRQCRCDPGGHSGISSMVRQSTVTGTLRITNAAGGVIAGASCSIEILEVDNGKIFFDNRGVLTAMSIRRQLRQQRRSQSRPDPRHRPLRRRQRCLQRRRRQIRAVDGGSGKDTLAGGPAADRLSGGPGADILTGRGGADRFVFDTTLNPATNTDKITDFRVNTDKIVLDKGDGHFLAVGSPGVLGAARFHVGPAAADASDRIIYNPNTGALSYDHDGRGGDPQIRFAALTTHLALDHADFVVALIEA